MRLGKRVVLVSLLAFVCLNLALRYPQTPHETGVDSFFIHTLAESINQEGQAVWLLNPFSIFGLYPLSYPSVGPFFFSEASQMAGIPLEGAVLLASLAFGAASVPISFMMGMAFRRDEVFALAVALIASLAPRFIVFTQWTGSTRGLFMFLLPVFVWSLLFAYRRHTKTAIALTVALLLLAAATHRLAVLLMLMLLALVMTYILALFLRLLRLRSPGILLSPRVRRYTALLSLLFIALTAVAILLGTNVLDEYESSRLGAASGRVEQMVVLAGSVSRSVGLALPFALVGVAYLPFLRNKGVPELLILLTLLAMIPTLFLRRYTGFYITPFIALFAGLGILVAVRLVRGRRRAAAAVVAFSLAALTATSAVTMNWEMEQTPYLQDDIYTTGLYTRHLPGENTVIANHGFYGVQVASISGKSYLPVGGAGTTFQSAEILIFGYYSGTEVVNQTVRIPLQNLTIESDSPFYLHGIQVEQVWAVILQNREYGTVSPRDLSRFRIAYYLDMEYLETSFTAYDNVYPSTFARSVKQGYQVDNDGPRYDARYKLFDGGQATLWVVYPRLAFR